MLRNEMETLSGLVCRLLLLHPFTPPLASIPIFGPNEGRQLGSAGWCLVLLGGIDSWIIPQATAADYQRRSHQGVPASSPYPQSLCPPLLPPVLSPVPLSPLVKRGTPSPSLLPGSSWQVISTITITAITGVINKWPTPSQGNNKGFIIHHARPYKYMPTGNKLSSWEDESRRCRTGRVCCRKLCGWRSRKQMQIEGNATGTYLNIITWGRGFLVLECIWLDSSHICSTLNSSRAAAEAVLSDYWWDDFIREHHWFSACYWFCNRGNT